VAHPTVICFTAGEAPPGRCDAEDLLAEVRRTPPSKMSYFDAVTSGASLLTFHHHNGARFLSGSGLNPTSAKAVRISPTEQRNRDLHFNLKTNTGCQEFSSNYDEGDKCTCVFGNAIRNLLTGEERRIVRTLNSAELVREVELPGTVLTYFPTA